MKARAKPATPTAQDIVCDVLAILDCIFTLNATGDIDGLLESTLGRLLSDAITRLIQLQELLAADPVKTP